MCQPILSIGIIMKNNSLVIMPTFECNLNCSYCWQDRTIGVIDISLLKLQLFRLSKHIVGDLDINIMGGELTQLDNFYEIFDTIYECTKYFKDVKNIRFTTNLTKEFDLSNYDLTIYGSLHTSVLTSTEVDSCINVYELIKNPKQLDILGPVPENIVDIFFNIIKITTTETNNQYKNSYNLNPDGKVFKNYKLYMERL